MSSASPTLRERLIRRGVTDDTASRLTHSGAPFSSSLPKGCAPRLCVWSQSRSEAREVGLPDEVEYKLVSVAGGESFDSFDPPAALVCLLEGLGGGKDSGERRQRSHSSPSHSSGACAILVPGGGNRLHDVNCLQDLNRRRGLNGYPLRVDN